MSQPNHRPSRLALLLAIAMGACEQQGTEPVLPLEALPRNLTVAEQEVIAGSNDFAFQLLKAVNAGQEDENVFISPLSVSMALGMTMNGAAGETFDEMRSTLGFTDLSQAEINQSYRSLLDLFLDLDPSVEMSVANSVWYRDPLVFKQSFFDAVEEAFDARVEGLDFNDPSAVTEINGWVDEATRSKIDKILDAIPDEAVMYLINAIYFKGSWTEQFDKSRTRNDSFDGLNGGTLPVRMMSNQGRYGYAWLPQYQALDLPYGNGAYTMTILLPPEGGDVNTFLGTLDDSRWSEIVNTLARGEVTVEIPRFRLEYEKSLNDPLIALGMRSAFDYRVADFSGMMDGPPGQLFISEVKHKTFVDVNEEGTEAAADPSVEVSMTSAPPTYRVDRPFVFVIRERFSGTILFAGKIVAPPAAS